VKRSCAGAGEEGGGQGSTVPLPPSGDGVHVRSVGPTMQPWAVAVDNSGLAYLPFYFYFLINLLFFAQINYFIIIPHCLICIATFLRKYLIQNLNLADKFVMSYQLIA